MILSQINNVQPEQKPKNDSTADSSQVTPAIGNTNVVRSAFSCPPYELSREEFNYFLELYHPDCASQSRVIKGGQNKMMQHAKMLEWLSFDVHKWLHEKAIKGDKEALFKLEYSYSLYDEVILKAKEQKLL